MTTQNFTFCEANSSIFAWALRSDAKTVALAYYLYEAEETRTQLEAFLALAED